MKFKNYYIFVFMFFSASLFGQVEQKDQIQGKITFITKNNVYVKFEKTDQIQIGDTLKIFSTGIPENCLVVVKKSSNNCVCTNISGKRFQIGYTILHNKKERTGEELIEESKVEESKEEISQEEANNNEDKEKEKEPIKEKIKARISAASYSTINPAKYDNHRMMYRLSFTGMNIKKSKFSAFAYLNYRQNFIDKSREYTGKTKYFSIYSLAIQYDLKPNTSLTFGRKINNKISSIGAIDGLQLDHYFGNNYIGVIAGLKPDIRNFTFNTNLLEYGAYIGRSKQGKVLTSRTTFGLLEQRNTGNIDRRYAYLQHSSTYKRKLSLFISSEVDLYTLVNNEKSSKPSITNIYTSLRYRPYRWLNATVSYDARKRIVYYETYKTEIEKLLEDDEARQGIRFRVNIKPLKKLNTGISYSKRFQNAKTNASDVINLYASYNSLPFIKGRLSARYNINTSVYRTGNILSVRYNRSIIKRKLSANFYFRQVKNQYINSELKYNLNYYGTGFTYRINRKLSFYILGELSTPKSGNKYRFNTKIIKRFDNKKKK